MPSSCKHVCVEQAPFSHVVMSYDLENTVINDILCYLSTSRNVLPNENIVSTAVAFYDETQVKKAKDLIAGICKERPTRRNACVSHPNPLFADVSDILDYFEKAEKTKILLPKFVADNYASLPPASGFDSIAVVLCSLREEIFNLRTEVTQLRESSLKDNKSFEDIMTVKQDISDIKTAINMNRNNNSTSGQVLQTRILEPESYAAVLQNPTPSQIATGPRSSPSSNESSNLSSSHTLQDRHRPPSTQNRPNANGRRTSNARLGAARPNQTHRRENRNIPGNREPGNSAFKGASRVSEVFVGGCLLDSTDNQLIEFCKDSGVELKKCESLNSKSAWYKSYKISVDFSDKDKVLSNDFWPKGIFVRKFYMPRQRTIA